MKKYRSRNKRLFPRGLLIFFLLIIIVIHELLKKNEFKYETFDRNKLKKILIKEYHLNKLQNLDLEKSNNSIVEKELKEHEAHFQSYLNLLLSLVINKNNISFSYENNVLRIKNDRNYWFNNTDDIFPIKIKNILILKIALNIKGEIGGGISLASQLGKNDNEWWIGLKELYVGIEKVNNNYYLSIQIKNNSKNCSSCYRIPLLSLKKKEDYYRFYLIIKNNNIFIFDDGNIFNNNLEITINRDFFEKFFFKKKDIKYFKIELSEKFFNKNKVYLGLGIGPKSEINIDELKLLIN